MSKIPSDLNDKHEYPGMVHWFSPIVLGKIVKKVIASSLFAQYADRRLMQASLDILNEKDTLEQRSFAADGLFKAKDGAVWLDYVADLGDGFDSTYSIAYLLGQKKLNINQYELPRAACLIMGGDQVYPDASRYDYETRMQRPYEFAFPRTNKPGAEHPNVYLIPGNHDWYDGLTLFLAKFCRGRETQLGSWKATQNRSYFAIHLSDDWWVWGYDSQLEEDIDIPQANYFASIARLMNPNSKVILCASVPTWLKADMYSKDASERDLYYRGLDYIANIIRNECPGAKIPVVLSGDLHHYSRYEAKESGVNFVTAGGGGAFLHPTHHLKDTLKITWAKSVQTLNLSRKADASGVEKEACYPSREDSQHMAIGNLLFIFKNYDFCLSLGVIYWVCSLLILSWGNYYAILPDGGYFNQMSALFFTPISVALFAVFLGVLINYVAMPDKKRRVIFGVPHAIIHFGILLISTIYFTNLLQPLQNIGLGELLYFLTFGVGMIFSGFLGGFIWGIYLLIISYFFGLHANDAFSAMRKDSFRHFIRMKLEKDAITLYPIGLDNSPKRKDWKLNNLYKENDQNEPAIIPIHPLEPRLIEEPIKIEVKNIRTLKV
ncbi:MAG: hypothetical protein A3B66_00460 [Alphaproteobacteria bacterium RIFCSPHIGHO2_02_FULL_46_13]|nr:MAG: hypothetical protein A3B66_00460 [Alphaproteobacteria bacterium RIFCSPHIGHO2_02_FULL_46_13]